MRNRLSIEAYVKGIITGDRFILSRAITLLESKLIADGLLAEEILQQILPYTGNSIRIGITGVPGVGKSTFIESFGNYITHQNKKIAVLAIDPTSQITKGSIMGDKTRMEQLSHNPLAYIRPSPSSEALGGVANKTREVMLLCEAAGFEFIIVETVGVGQSETQVKGMVDFFLLLMLAGAGDELQGIKRGIMEMADAVVITKADGTNKLMAQQAVGEYRNALHLMPSKQMAWTPPVLTCSAQNNEGIDSILQIIEQYIKQSKQQGYFENNRQIQNIEWLHTSMMALLQEAFYNNSVIKEQLKEIEENIKHEKILPRTAAHLLIDMFLKK